MYTCNLSSAVHIHFHGIYIHGIVEHYKLLLIRANPTVCLLWLEIQMGIVMSVHGMACACDSSLKSKVTHHIVLSKLIWEPKYEQDHSQHFKYTVYVVGQNDFKPGWFVFSFDPDVNVVGENEARSKWFQTKL